METRVGLLGGTFNPVHRGHIDLGLAIREAFYLDNVFYILSARPPHKKTDDIAPAEIRWKMLLNALSSYPFFKPCDIEMKRAADSWTIDTIDELNMMFPNHHFYFISGSEGFLKIRTWKNYKNLLRMISFIVVLREKSHELDVENLLNEEGIEFGHNIPLPGETLSPHVYLYSYRSNTIGISSTLIRRKIKLSETIDNLVEPEVKKIMEENKLYER